jgi:phosphohistidine phosphatase
MTTTQHKIYLIRHGLAGQFGDYEDDSIRPLSTDGRAKTRKVAKQLSGLGVQFDRVLSSPYVRAYQTAEILQAAKLCDSIETADFLKPGSIESEESFGALLNWLMQWRDKIAAEKTPTDQEETIAIVGHEPDLSSIAEQLMFGQTLQRLVLKKAGVIALNAPSEGDFKGNCQLLWLVSPKILLA